MKLAGPLAARSPGLRLALALEIERHRSADEILKAASSTLSPSWMSMARRTFPSRLELNRPEGSFNAAPLANVILTTFLYVSPVQTMPPWDQTGVHIHFHSSRISGSASCTISRTFASVFPRQSPSSLILASMIAEAGSIGRVLSCTAPTLAPNLAALGVTCNLHKWTDGWPILNFAFFAKFRVGMLEAGELPHSSQNQA